VEEGNMLVKPIRDFLDFSGSFKTNKKQLSNTQLHEMFAKYMVHRKKRPSIKK